MPRTTGRRFWSIFTKIRSRLLLLFVGLKQIPLSRCDPIGDLNNPPLPKSDDAGKFCVWMEVNCLLLVICLHQDRFRT